MAFDILKLIFIVCILLSIITFGLPLKATDFSSFSVPCAFSHISHSQFVANPLSAIPVYVYVCIYVFI